MSHFTTQILKNTIPKNLKVKTLSRLKKKQTTAVNLTGKSHYLNHSSYLSFTINLSCSSVSISSDSSFTVLIIPFSLFSSFRNSYRPCSKAALQDCLSVTWSKHRNLKFLKNQKPQSFSANYCLNLIMLSVKPIACKSSHSSYRLDGTIMLLSMLQFTNTLIAPNVPW